MELLDFSELPAALLAVDSLLQPLVSLHQEENGDRHDKVTQVFTDSALQHPADWVENCTETDFQRQKSQRRPGQIKLTFIAALEHSGTPSLYFPVINPQASGDQVIAPTPITHGNKGRISISEQSGFN